MAKNMKPYPCEVKVGDHIFTKDGRERILSAIEGKYLRFEDGTLFSRRHPDLIGVKDATIVAPVVDEPIAEAIADEDVLADTSVPKKRGRKPSVHTETETEIEE